jgi:hypothetical protein
MAERLDPVNDGGIARLVREGAVPYLPNALARSFDREISPAEGCAMVEAEFQAWVSHFGQHLSEMSRDPRYNTALAAEKKKQEAAAKAKADEAERKLHASNGKKAARKAFGRALASKIAQLEWYSLALVDNELYAVLDDNEEATLAAARNAALDVKVLAQRVNGWQLAKQVQRIGAALHDVDPPASAWAKIAAEQQRQAEAEERSRRERRAAERQKGQETRLYGVPVSSLADE